VDTGGYTSGGASARAHGLAGRYATALFELAAAETAIDTVENGLAAVRGALAESDDLKTLITSRSILPSTPPSLADSSSRSAAA
jgi:F-type H+-transporting ATPase subunit delta